VTRIVSSRSGEVETSATGRPTSSSTRVAEYGTVAEFGLINATIHQVDERVKVDDIETLTAIYEQMLVRYFKPDKAKTI